VSERYVVREAHVGLSVYNGVFDTQTDPHMLLGEEGAPEDATFNRDQAVQLRRIQEGPTETWEVRLKGHHAWNGGIERLFLEYIVPPLLPKDAVTVSLWDFTTLPKSKWVWTFKGGNKTPSGQGALLMTKLGGPVPEIAGLELDSSDVTTVVIDMHAAIKTKSAETAIPLERVHLYWARKEDVERESAWPFSNERALRFRPLDAQQPGVMMAQLAGHPEWTGIIERLFVGVDLPETALRERGDHFNVYTKRIEFLHTAEIDIEKPLFEILTDRVELLK